MEIVEEIVYDDFMNFHEDISVYGKLRQLFSGYIFRGQESIQYSLHPTAFRRDAKSIEKIKNSLKEKKFPVIQTNFDQIFTEYIILKNFYRLSNYRGLFVPHINYFLFENQDELLRSFLGDSSKYWIPDELVELAGLAQHYGVPTRMLDWTFNIYVALYFASKGACETLYKNREYDDYLELWALNYRYFQKISRENFGIRFVTPSYHNNPNLCAQKGILTYLMSNRKLTAPLDIEPLDKFIKTKFFGVCKVTLLYRIKINYKCAKDIFMTLNSMEYSASSIFPGYAGIAQEMDEKKYIYQL